MIQIVVSLGLLIVVLGLLFGGNKIARGDFE